MAYLFYRPATFEEKGLYLFYTDATFTLVDNYAENVHVNGLSLAGR